MGARKNNDFSEAEKNASSFMRAMKISWLLLNQKEKIWCAQLTTDHEQWGMSSVWKEKCSAKCAQIFSFGMIFMKTGWR